MASNFDLIHSGMQGLGANLQQYGQRQDDIKRAEAAKKRPVGASISAVMDHYRQRVMGGMPPTVAAPHARAEIDLLQQGHDITPGSTFDAVNGQGMAAPQPGQPQEQSQPQAAPQAPPAAWSPQQGPLPGLGQNAQAAPETPPVPERYPPGQTPPLPAGGAPASAQSFAPQQVEGGGGLQAPEPARPTFAPVPRDMTPQPQNRVNPTAAPPSMRPTAAPPSMRAPSNYTVQELEDLVSMAPLIKALEDRDNFHLAEKQVFQAQKDAAAGARTEAIVGGKEKIAKRQNDLATKVYEDTAQKWRAQLRVAESALDAAMERMRVATGSNERVALYGKAVQEMGIYQKSEDEMMDSFNNLAGMDNVKQLAQRSADRVAAKKDELDKLYKELRDKPSSAPQSTTTTRSTRGSKSQGGNVGAMPAPAGTDLDAMFGLPNNKK